MASFDDMRWIEAQWLIARMATLRPMPVGDKEGDSVDQLHPFFRVDNGVSFAINSTNPHVALIGMDKGNCREKMFVIP